MTLGVIKLYLVAMSSVNKVILVGYIGDVPTNRLLRDGTNILSFTLITNESFHKGTQRIEHNEYHLILMPDALAELEMHMPVKGERAYIQGSVKTRSFIDENQHKHYVTEILASSYTRMS